MLTYEGQEMGQWKRLRTYGGKLVENITQAVARDCLAEAITRVAEAGYQTVMHIHDEIVLDTASGSLDQISKLISQPIPWAQGLPLNADGFEGEYYKKEG
jgi:DNA polymerase